MKQTVVLDSSPLGLIVQRRDYQDAERCRQWVRQLLASGTKILIPEIVDYELRRELLRLQKAKAIAQLDRFTAADPTHQLPITSAALSLAAKLWADVRRRGKPTADPHALDVDVILSAQVLAAGLNPGDFVVATSNVSHVGLFVPAVPWQTIT